MLIQQLFCKYPTDVIIRLEESKESDTPLNMVSLQKAITQYIIQAWGEVLWYLYLRTLKYTFLSTCTYT